MLGNPTGGAVVAGAATIGGAGPTLTINQSSNQAIINWQQFSIANGELTKFLVPNTSSATLNRVIGGNPSAIYGSLQSNGIVYLVNPSGIVVGPTGRIDTAGFLASTLDVSNKEFLKGGDLHFAGASDASIDNEGIIHASVGDVYLIANQVKNNGTLSAPQGTVGLAAGSDILFQQGGNQHLFVQATPAGMTRAVGVTNAGTIRAAAAELKAAGGNAFALAINNTGTIAATGYKKVNGQVYLMADGGNITNSGQISAKTASGDGGTIVLNGHGTSSSGTVLNSGSLLATGKAAGKKGGTVEVLGNRVGITDHGVVDVSGDAGGGTALIGGDEHGSNPDVANADQTYLGPDATISADALTLGTGGKVILWGNETTQVYGQISATGGAQGGNGGFVETSAAVLDAQTAPNVSAPHGTNGTWLLDPSDVTISDTASDSGFNTSPAFTITSGTVTISQTTLLTALLRGDVTIDASTPVGVGGGGTITWTQTSTPLTITNARGHTLTLDAPVSLTLNGVTVNASGNGGLNIVLNSSLSGAGSVNVQGSTLILNGGNFTANGNGYTSTVNANGEANGVNLFDTTINSGGGNITLTGNAGYTTNVGIGLEGGLGVGIGTDGSTNVSLNTSGTGNITITGTFNQAVTSVTGFNAVDIYQDSSATNINHLTVADGLISITGTVSQGTTSGTGVGGASIGGVGIQSGSILQATGAGSITLTGDTSAATDLVSGINSSSITGVEIAGNLSTSIGGISIIGTSGTINTSSSTLAGSLASIPFTAGVLIDTGAQITTGITVPLTIIGTGGAVVTTSAFTGDSSGVVFDSGTTLSMGTGAILNITGFGGAVNAGNGANAGDSGSDGVDVGGSISVATGGSISITGTGGSLDTSNAFAITGNNNATATGVRVHGNANVAAAGTTTVTLMGTGGNINAGSGLVGGSTGVEIGAENSKSTVVSSASGTISITGNAGTAPGQGLGVAIDGFNLGSGSVESTTGNIAITGTGGSGYTGTGVVVGNYVPNYGVVLVDNATVTTGGSGTITLTGTGGANSFGIGIEELTSNPTLDANPVLPVITAGGAFTATALSGTGIFLNATVNAASATLGSQNGGAAITSGPLDIESATITLAGGDFTAFGTGSTGTNPALNGITVANSTINSGGGSINLTGQSSFGSNASGQGVYINNSILESADASTQPSITTGNISILGNGSPGTGVTALNNLIGVDITHSVVSVVGGTLLVTGNVNSGTAQAVLNQDGSSNINSGRSIGVLVDNGSAIKSTGTGSVILVGDTTSSTATISNLGIDITGLDPTSSAIVPTIVSAAGGVTGILMTGTAGMINNSPTGTNVQTPSTTGIVIEFGGNIEATGSAPITLAGTGGADENINTSLTNEKSYGISIDASPTGTTSGSPNILISSVNGAISLNGIAGSSVGDVSGISVNSESGASATITSSNSNISMIGAVPNQSLVETLSSTSNGGATGVDIGGDQSTGSVSSVTALAGSIDINGTVTSGTDNTKEAGVVINNNSQVIASGTGGLAGTTAQGDVTIFGDTVGSTSQSLNAGIFIEGSSTTVSASGIVADANGGTGLTLTGVSSTINGSTGATLDQNNGVGGIFLEPVTAGIAIINGATVESLGSALMNLIGTGGTNANTLNSATNFADPTTGDTSASYGVVLFSTATGQTTSLSSGGNLSIIGTAGSSPTTGIGVMIGGPSNVGAVSVTSAGAILIDGIGGAVTGNTDGVVPNSGVGIFNPGNVVNDANNNPISGGTANVSANGGGLTIIGTAGTGSSTGVDMSYYDSPGHNSSFDPGLTTSGNLSITAVTGRINSFASFGAQSIFFSSATGTSSIIQDVGHSPLAPLSLNGGDYAVTEISDAVQWGTVNVTNLSITGFGLIDTNLGAITTGNLTITTQGKININGVINATGLVTIQNTGDNIVFGTNGSISDSGTGSSDNVILAAGTDLPSSHYIINNSSSGTNAIQVTGGNFYLYSGDPTSDAFGGIAVQPANIIFNATFATTGLPTANQELFYVATANDVGPNNPGTTPPPPPPPTSPLPSTDTGGAANGGSNIVPPVLTPQPPQQGATVALLTGNSNLGSTPPPPPFSFVGTGASGLTGLQDGGLANSSSNSGQVGAGDAAQLGGGGLNNVANPHASGVLSQALGPVVYHSLADALKTLGDFVAADIPGAGGGNAGGDGPETILSGGDVAVIGDSGVKNIPPGQAPPQLRNALGGDVLKGMGSGTGH